jgi:hypothetical protein
MNKNTRQRIKAQRKVILKEGGFPKPTFKKKVQPFPRPNPDVDMSIKAQCETFYGKVS